MQSGISLEKTLSQTTSPNSVKMPTPATPSKSSKSEAEREEDVVLFREYGKTKVFNEDGKITDSDEVLRNKLANRNCKLVTYVVNKFYNKKKEHKALREDLLQEGSLGLLSAIDGFNPELGFRFSTYATWWIKQSISNYLLSQDPRLHVPSHIRTAQNKVLKKMKELKMDFHDLIEENAESLGITDKMLESINASLKSKWVYSMEEPASNGESSGGDGGKVTLKDLLVDENAAQSESLTDYTTLIAIVKEGLASLTERERNIILLRYDVIQAVPVSE